ncbi:MAG: hypothetical protein RLZZ299_228 [Pseudomonadota bacterium]
MLLLALLGCSLDWNLPGGPSATLALPAWDRAVVPASDGVYVRLPAGGALVRVAPDGAVDRVDLRGAAPDRVVAAPDGDTLLVFASWSVCEDPDPDVRTLEDCAVDDRAVGHELAVVRGASVLATADVPPQYNALAFSGDGRLAVAYLDLTQAPSIEVDGVLNLAEAVFLEVATGETHRVPVGFAAEHVLFTQDGSAAVVLSRNEVAVVDLASWSVAVRFPLTLDVDSDVTPRDVALVRSEDTDYALVTLEGGADLYVLDLTHESIDLVELGGEARSMVVDTAAGRTFLGLAGRSAIVSVDHAAFELDTVALDAPAPVLLGGDGMVLGYAPGSYQTDVVLLDTLTGTTTEFRAENPIASMALLPSHAHAVATLSPGGSGTLGGYHALALFDLVAKDAPLTLALEAAPVGLEVVESGGEAWAFLLQEGVDTLLRVDVATGTASDVALAAPPVGLATMPDGTFVVVHDGAMGMLSFLAPGSSTPRAVGGFASVGLLHDTTLPRRAASE